MVLIYRVTPLAQTGCGPNLVSDIVWWKTIYQKGPRRIEPRAHGARNKQTSYHSPPFLQVQQNLVDLP
jgi:hypothetical protein